VLCFYLELVDLWKADRYKFESPFVCVEPAPFFQGVFKVQTKTQALFAIAVQMTLRGSQADVKVQVSISKL
jgi:hypothetical protein